MGFSSFYALDGASFLLDTGWSPPFYWALDNAPFFIGHLMRSRMNGGTIELHCYGSGVLVKKTFLKGFLV